MLVFLFCWLIRIPLDYGQDLWHEVLSSGEAHGAVWSSETVCFFHLYLHVAQVLLLTFFFLNVLRRRRLDFDGDGLE